MSQEVKSDAGKVQFLQHHRPGLTPGDYEIAIKQVVEIKRPANTGTFIAEQKFSVAGERFELKPTDVQAVFPPDGNLGNHFNVFPHIILNRSTLPWERVAEVESAQPTVPWLALLIFDADEKPKVQTLTLAQLKVAGAEKFQPLPLVLEKGQHDNDVVTVIDVPASQLKKIMPTAKELAMLAHVRFGIGGKSNGEQVSVVISNRLPQRGKTSFAYLVSLEKRLRNGIVEGVDGDGVIRLVSLQSWSFACDDPQKDFRELLLNLNKTSGPPATLRLPIKPSAPERLKTLLSTGYVLLPHHLRHGDQTASWFHGPLISGEYTNPVMDLPARTADELVRYDKELAMFDVSYAAAWELGRLLALQDKDFSTSLYQWKRQHAQGLAQKKQQVARLPFQKLRITRIPQPVLLWFERLRKLEGVPFNYLVPDERMLPAESIRFFRVDEAWIDCLADGAFSIGRVSSSDHAADKLQAKKNLAASVGEPRMGFLLRSEVVSGWPGLMVEAYPNRDKLTGEKPLDVVRIDRLDAGVLLCVFEGNIGRVEIYQKPEALHFGLNVEGAGYSKVRRNPESGEPKKGNIVNLEPRHWRSDSPKTLNVTVLANSLNENPSAPFTSSQFALQMVEGAEKVVFRTG